jgi:outer membrane protein TolC
MKFRAVFVTLALSSAAAAQPSETPPGPHQETLTLARAVELALQQQPSVRQTQAQIESARARVESARVAQHPTVTVAGTVATGSSRVNTLVTPTTGGFFDPTLNTGLSASAQWRIYDFGQTRANIRAAEANAAAVEATLGTTNLDIHSAVANAFLEAVARSKLITVAEATVKSEELHLDQAKRFVAAQAKDPIEVVQAQARAANAKSTLAQAQNNEAVALAVLRSEMGSTNPEITFVVDPNWPTPPAENPGELAVLVQSARQKRPEIVALDRQIIAAEAEITAAKAQRRPVLNATANTQWNPGEDDWSPQPSWNAGLTLSWQLYDGGRAHADVRAAQAQLASTVAERDGLLVSLTSQLEAARSQIGANRANVSASSEAVFAARAQLKLAEARYAQGLGSQIELTDAQFAVTTAEGNLISAEWQLASSWVQLRRALGEF